MPDEQRPPERPEEYARLPEKGRHPCLIFLLAFIGFMVLGALLLFGACFFMIHH